jgi:hypothetical protein
MKVLFSKVKSLAAPVLVAGVALASVSAHAGDATGPDFSVLTGSIDWSGVTTGILAVAAALIVVYVAMKGSKILISMVRGA